jgi:hypothetical protein
VKTEHGSRSKLIDALAEAEKRGKDAGYRTRLERFSTPELAQQLNAVKRRTKLATAKAAPKAPRVAKVAPKKAAPKAAAKPTPKKGAPKGKAKKKK